MKEFNTSVVCIPDRHYMVDMSEMIDKIIKRYILKDRYFVINRARQYGKTTTLALLENALKEKYYVVSISFAGTVDMFTSEKAFAKGFIGMIYRSLKLSGLNNELLEKLFIEQDSITPLLDLSDVITELCSKSDKEIILMIDEVDEAANNDILIYFLAMLRNKYIERSLGKDYTFKSVILAGVYDIKNLKLKMRPESEHKYNSPWNVAVNFNVDMGLPQKGIVKMLEEYRADNGLSFDAEWFGQQIYDYTSGYPFLVSRICELIDTEVSYEDEFDSLEKAWTPMGLQRAIKILIKEQNTLFDDLNKKMESNKELKELIYQMVIQRETVSFNVYNDLVQLGYMFGWLKEKEGKAVISNRIFETVICDKLLDEQRSTQIFKMGDLEQFKLKTATELDMDLIVKRFAVHFKSLYAEKTTAFLENEARMIFLTFLKPIINGTGNYYQESQVADSTRTDVVIDYHGNQYIVELKIWHGESYEQSGREQLCGCLEKYNLQKGWLVSFCFNKNKEELVGEKTIEINGRTITETVI